MFQTKKSRWRTLENTAKIFPATSGRRDERVFRVACELKEEVDGGILQEALEQTAEKFPVFLCVLRKGLFWNYLEESSLRPAVRQEYRPPCSALYIRDQKNLLFEVTYYKKRISFETYHALTDGTGAVQFLRALVWRYLCLRHPKQTAGCELEEERALTDEELEEDGFRKYYGSGRQEEIPKYRAHQFPYRRREHGALKLIEGVLSTKELLAAARQRNTTVTVLLAAVYLCAIAQDMSPRQKRRPVALMVPVNLRRFFPSESMRNFFGWLDVGCQFGEGEADLEEVIRQVDAFFRRELTPGRMAARMDSLVRFEKNPLVRVLPLELKLLIMQAAARLGTNEDTAVFSNVGRIEMPSACGPYLDYFEFYTTTPTIELCMCSYGDKTTLAFTSAFVTNKVEENFFRILEQLGLPAELTAGLGEGKEREKERFLDFSAQRTSFHLWYRLFTFWCIAAAVICGVADLLVTPGITFAWYVAGTTATVWALTTVGFRKRRHPLKNSLWQMVLVAAGLVLWDWGTGFDGWSLEIGLPGVIVAGLAAMAVLIVCFRLNSDEYMIYLLAACAAGILPAVLLAAGIVSLKAPALVCLGICILVLAALCLFQGGAVKNELQKKFHV